MNMRDPRWPQGVPTWRRILSLVGWFTLIVAIVVIVMILLSR